MVPPCKVISVERVKVRAVTTKRLDRDRFSFNPSNKKSTRPTPTPINGGDRVRGLLGFSNKPSPAPMS